MLILTGCGSEQAKPGQGGVSDSDAAELDQAAEIVEKRSGNPSSGVPAAAQPGGEQAEKGAVNGE